MRTVFQVVATMVVANAAVAYGAGAKDAAAKIKGAAATKAADVKATAKDAAAAVKSEATSAAAEVKGTATDAVKTAEATEASTEASATPTAEEAKTAVQGAMEGQPVDGTYLAGARKSLIRPESGVLPESVLRFRAIYGMGEVTRGYDGAGNKVENGLKVTTTGATAVLEYGITDRISAQFLVPYRLKGEAKVDSDDKFSKVGLLQLLDDKIEEITHAVSSGPYSAEYANNAAAPGDVPLVPAFAGTPFAAATTITQGTPLRSGVEAIAATMRSIVRNPSADPQTAAALLNYAKSLVKDQKFQEGLGDIEIGAKYALSTVEQPWFDGVPFYTSVAAGVRLDSSKYADATKKGETPVGRGTTDAAIRLNADYEPILGVQLQLENQTEFMVAKGKAWNYSEANDGKEFDLERKGARQLGYSKLVVAPGTWVPALDTLVLNARYSWSNDSKTVLGTVEKLGGNSRTAVIGASFDGLNLENRIPVQLDYDRYISARGRDVENAADAHVVTLKLFYKF